MGRKYNCDYDFFETIDSEEKAYWLGYLYADGCIMKRHKNSFITKLCSIDFEHIEKFKQSLQSNHKIHYFQPSSINYNNKIYCCQKVSEIRINSYKLANDLIKLGCVSRKSLILEFPNYNQVPEYLMKHFIRGYFDGDGAILFKENFDYRMTFLGTYNFLFKLNLFLGQNGFDYQKIRKTVSKIYEIKYTTRNRLIKFINYLYKDAVLYLDRKYNKAIELLNYLEDYDNRMIIKHRNIEQKKKMQRQIKEVMYAS